MKTAKLGSFILIFFVFNLITSCADDDTQGGLFDTTPTLKLDLSGNGIVYMYNSDFMGSNFGGNGITIPWSSTMDGEVGEEWTWEVGPDNHDPNTTIIGKQFIDGDLISTDTAFGRDCTLYLRGSITESEADLPPVIKFELKGNATVSINNADFMGINFGSTIFYEVTLPWTSVISGYQGNDWTWQIEEENGDASAIIIANQYQDGLLISTDTAFGAGSSLNLSGIVQ